MNQCPPIHSSEVLLAFSSLNVAGQILKNVASNAFATILGKTFVSHYILISRFVESVINDEKVPVPPEEGRETKRVIEEIVRRLDQNVRLEEVTRGVDPFQDRSQRLEDAT